MSSQPPTSSESSVSKFGDQPVPIRNLKLICGAMLSGTMVFSLLLCTIIDFAKLNTEPKMLVLMACSVGAMMFMSSLVFFKVLSGQTRAKSDSLMSNLGLLQTAWIVRFAIIEGACFLNLIVTMLHDSLLTLFVAVLGILLMLLGFPRTSVVEDLLQNRMK